MTLKILLRTFSDSFLEATASENVNMKYCRGKAIRGYHTWVSWSICWKMFFPPLREISLLATNEVVMLGLVLLGVLGKELVPLLLLGSTLSNDLVADVVNLLGNDKALLGVEAEGLLQLLDVVGLEGGAVNTVCTLLLGAKANGCCEFDKGRLVLDLLGLLDSGGNTLKVVVTISHGQSVPAVGLVALKNILGEGDFGITVNGDMVVVPDGNEVTELEVTSE